MLEVLKNVEKFFEGFKTKLYIENGVQLDDTAKELTSQATGKRVSHVVYVLSRILYRTGIPRRTIHSILTAGPTNEK